MPRLQSPSFSDASQHDSALEEFSLASELSESEQDEEDDLFCFTGSGVPADFYIYMMADEDSAILSETITHHGGRIIDIEEDADVVLTNSKDFFDMLKDKYATSLKPYVRMSHFVDDCIAKKRFVLQDAAPSYKRRGRKLGAKHVPFTAEDDLNLAKYLAQLRPSGGGRMSHKIYNDLERRVRDSTHSTAKAFILCHIV
ncbi:hypothetical protein FA95DRAFT_1614208 [Auriscalpium vulgare]|uniref:Uncharacterized protein n=1 Tax=Auriscalpium vulgare TaxID=40419 RepID=A0ACB8R0M7_9AGAM|nr:hypothetical protein FA95DRAFT_1614208 [Auriscalpium vulgare]